MGQRYENSKKNVTENKRTLERLHTEKDTLHREYEPLSLLESIQSLIDDEAANAIQEVKAAGNSESQRIESETDTAEEEKEQIAGEITKEIEKLNSGLEKLRRAGGLEFGKKAVEQSSQEYKKQINKFRSLMDELGEQTTDANFASIGGGSVEGAAEMPTPMSEGDVISISRMESSHSTPIDLAATGSSGFTSIIDSLQAANVSYRPIQLFEGERTADEIVARLSGGDLTEGSCSSLALAYAGNKAGYDVLDFRDGDSRAFFSSRDSIQKIASLPGVKSTVLNGTNDIASANQLLGWMTPGKEYYLATGQHASIVRRNGDAFEYLELQHPSGGNGWHNLDDNILMARFGCRSTHMVSYSNFLIDVDSLSSSHEFLDILGYINTADVEQRKGGAGNVR